ncbi:MAG: hydroxymethylglutaryl-CoA lyase [Phycisphaeraceae bacterium]|nr:hydroxymethylglutaryl-CoA lyase [Phycisphaeraceae bacterium]
MSEPVRITEVALRDGLQNEAAQIATVDKAHLAGLLARTGVDEIEVSSFVSSRWIPQLGDAAELFAMIAQDAGRWPLLSALVPNARGMQSALEVNARAGRQVVGKVSVFTAASETFSQRNTNATIAESLERFGPVLAMANEAGLPVRGYVSCIVACPFEGPIKPDAVAAVASALAAAGVVEIDLGDTIGAATPERLLDVLDAVGDALGKGWRAPGRLTVHLHDTFGGAAECVRASLEWGIRSFDGSAGGLGGCPYASVEGRRAPGNISTMRLVETISGAGYRTAVDMEALREASKFAEDIVARSRGA